eukprot:7146443-Prymnesium_polylepis.1
MACSHPNMGMPTSLIWQHGSLVGFLTNLDVETLAEACKGFGTDDTRLIKVLGGRSKVRPHAPHVTTAHVTERPV